ncbi:D-aminoacylase [Mesorhizobium sp. CAU 1741]|uniref:N-acyl-D-amino-acid deacylase family protein n=1 Tax=Mesorhizobium sp. CAU 1741 TaxID=3140366 RepID=UPI00325BEEA8
MKVDIIFRNADIIDGTGGPRRRGDVAITDDRITAVGDLSEMEGGREEDCSGLAVAPGFIDPHVHNDLAVFTHPDMASVVSQGVTTIINGNCGFSLAPLTAPDPLPQPLRMLFGINAPRFGSFGEYCDRLRAEPPAVNAGCLIGHGTLRVNEVADLERPADEGELRAMSRALDKALGQGGIGLSTGPFYAPARASSTHELTEMARVAQRHAKLYVTHMRDEGDRVVEALEETLEIGRTACCGVHISHHKCAGVANFGVSERTLAIINAAMKHQDVGLDTTPWTASSTILNSGRHRQAQRVIVAESEPFPEHAGRDLADVAREWGVNLDEAVERLLPATGIFFIMDEQDVQRILRFEHTMICSDGIAGGTHPHPRVWGTFPRVLGHYARDVGLFSLEEGVRRMTSLTADRFGLKERGRLRVGNFADIVVFDPATIHERATYDTPVRPAEGIVSVYVNGTAVWKDGQVSNSRPGHVLA